MPPPVRCATNLGRAWAQRSWCAFLAVHWLTRALAPGSCGLLCVLLFVMNLIQDTGLWKTPLPQLVGVWCGFRGGGTRARALLRVGGGWV